MDSKSERVRLAAALRASDILLEHQRGEERAAVAIERAQARKAEAEATASTPETPASETVDEFLARVKAESQRGTEK
jgi:hypothetical protein